MIMSGGFNIQCMSLVSIGNAFPPPFLPFLPILPLYPFHLNPFASSYSSYFLLIPLESLTSPHWISGAM